MSKHVWVVMQVTPLDVETQEDGSLTVTATEAAIEIAVDDSMMGCWFCHAPLTAENAQDECPHVNNAPDLDT